MPTMSIDFLYAQARIRARLGQRLPEGGWRLIESSLGLAQYLHSARASILAPRVQHFTTRVSPHTIDRSLRSDWREEVAAVGRWVPERWREAVCITTWLPYLPIIAYLEDGGATLDWMHDDSVLTEMAQDDIAARRLALGESPCAGFLPAGETPGGSKRWIASWRDTWPAMGAVERSGLEQLLATVDRFSTENGAAKVGRARREWLVQLDRTVARLLRRHTGQPVVVFCYLLLAGLDLQRLRDGLVRHALFNDVIPEAAA
jgi:hypothetical protein